jgi:hypothetical protein
VLETFRNVAWMLIVETIFCRATGAQVCDCGHS